MVSTF